MKKPLFNFGPPKQITKKDKKLNYKQARKKLGINPFGDADRDGYFNIFDCKPLDSTKHMGVEREREHIKHQVYDTSKGFQTEGEIFKEAEKIMPDEFGPERHQEGGEYSEHLTKALKIRKKSEEKEGDTVTKAIAGIHEIVRPRSVSEETIFAQHHLKTYLQGKHPEKQFKFDPYKPSIIQMREEGKYEPIKIAKALTMSPPGIKTSVRIPKDIRKKLAKEDVEKITSGFSSTPPWQIGELPRHFTSGKKIKLEITDRPARVLAKSMFSGLDSCEAISGGMCRWGPFSDVAHRHPIAYFYLGGKTPQKDDPSARIMLRRGHPVKDTGYDAELDTSKEFIGVAPTTYGLSEESDKELYPYLLQSFIKKKGAFHLPLKTAKPHAGYADSVAHSISEQEDPSVYPFLRREFKEKVEQKAEYEGGDYSATLEAMEYEGEEDVIEHLDDIGLFHHIPDVFVKEFQEPSSTYSPPTFKESREQILQMPGSDIEKPRKIPQSFFHHLLRSEQSDTRYEAMLRPKKETKWQKQAIKGIKQELYTPAITPERKEVLTERLGRAEKQLKKYEEVEPKHYHQMAFDTEESIRASVSAYPRLEQRTIKTLIPEKKYDVREGKQTIKTSTPKMEYAIREGLFFNPALTFKQRKAVGRIEQEGEDKLVRISSRLDSATDPRVAREVVNIYAPEEVKRIVSTSSKPALHEIYKTQPELREDVALNPSAPEALVQQYITDVSEDKSISSSRKLEMINYLLEHRTLSDKMYQRIYNMYKDNEEVLDNMLYHQIPKSIKNKIESKISRSGLLTAHVLRNPTCVSTNTLKNLVKTFSKGDFLSFVGRSLEYHLNELSNKDEIIREVISRMLREPSTAPAIMNRFSQSSIKSETVDKELMRVLGRSTVSKKLFAQVLDYLMKSEYHNTRDELVKKFG